MLMRDLLPIQTNAGFTLLEVLVAIVVFSVGLLGLAALQIFSLRLSHDSLLRTTATILANDMADRMRANPVEAARGINSLYNNPLGLATGNPHCLSKDESGNDIDTACTPAERAMQDFYEWRAKLSGHVATSWHPEIKSELPTGEGVVCIDSTPDDGLPPPNDSGCDNLPTNGKNIYTIKIWWSERKDNASVPNKRHQFVMQVNL